MNTRKKNPLLIFLAITTFTISCGKDFLNSPLKRELYRDLYINNLQTSTAYLNGMYLQLYGIYAYAPLSYGEVTADNLRPVPSKSPVTNVYEWKQSPTYENMDYFTQSSVNANGLSVLNYTLIHSCNYLLKTVEKFRSENSDTCDYIKGQAHLLRSLAYFQLVNVFAQAYSYTNDASHPGVAIITSDDWTDKVNGRNTVAEVYASMIDDLQTAYALLPDVSASNITPTKKTAEALLARVYIFKGDYLQAKNHASAVIQRTNLLSIKSGYPDAMFKAGNETQTESLLHLLPASVIGAVASTQVPLAGAYLGTRFRTASFYHASADIAAALKSNSKDVRSKWITLTAGDNWITKYPTKTVATGDTLHYYQSVIRVSEMFLIAAESYAQLNMEDSARYFLYQVRKRADTTAIPPLASGSLLLDSIKFERRKELSFEGLRMYDLQRWKQGVYRTDPIVESARTLPYPSPRAIAPMPLQEVKLYGFEPNPGY